MNLSPPRLIDLSSSEDEIDTVDVWGLIACIDALEARMRERATGGGDGGFCFYNSGASLQVY